MSVRWLPLVAGVCLLLHSGIGMSAAQDAGSASTAKHGKTRRNSALTLSKADRSSVIAVALHSQSARRAGRDCSHMVHAIYEHAGFPYPYADSDDLFDGAKGFRRVSRPQPADLVVWHGHVGIVIRPSAHQFFSLLSTGPGVDDYRSRYWKGRGQPRFYRYVKQNT